MSSYNGKIIQQSLDDNGIVLFRKNELNSNNNNNHNDNNKINLPAFGKRKFSEEEAKRIQELLSKNVDSSVLKIREVPGGNKSAYLEVEGAIKLANDLFGDDGWSLKIISMSQDQTDTSQFIYTAHVRIILKDGSYRENVGCGSTRFLSNIANAKKTAITDGLKRCLKLYGNGLGNSLSGNKFNKSIVSYNNNRFNNYENNNRVTQQQKQQQLPPTASTATTVTLSISQTKIDNNGDNNNYNNNNNNNNNNNSGLSPSEATVPYQYNHQNVNNNNNYNNNNNNNNNDNNNNSSNNNNNNNNNINNNNNNSNNNNSNNNSNNNNSNNISSNKSSNIGLSPPKPPGVSFHPYGNKPLIISPSHANKTSMSIPQKVSVSASFHSQQQQQQQQQLEDIELQEFSIDMDSALVDVQ
ncbi:hypothetical protein ACTFIV_005079 [Dictyostelium citrinum]